MSKRGRQWDSTQEDFIYELSKERMANGQLMGLAAITMFYNEEYADSISINKDAKIGTWIPRSESAIASRLHKYILPRKSREIFLEKRKEERKKHNVQAVEEVTEPIKVGIFRKTVEVPYKFIQKSGKQWTLADKIFLYENWDSSNIHGANNSEYAKEQASELGRTADACRVMYSALKRDDDFLYRYENNNVDTGQHDYGTGLGILNNEEHELYIADHIAMTNSEPEPSKKEGYRGFTLLFFRLFTWSKNRKDRRKMKRELKRQSQEAYRKYVEGLE